MLLLHTPFLRVTSIAHLGKQGIRGARRRRKWEAETGAEEAEEVEEQYKAQRGEHEQKKTWRVDRSVCEGVRWDRAEKGGTGRAEGWKGGTRPVIAPDWRCKAYGAIRPTRPTKSYTHYNAHNISYLRTSRERRRPMKPRKRDCALTTLLVSLTKSITCDEKK